MNYARLGEGKKVQLVSKPCWHTGLGWMMFDWELLPKCQINFLKKNVGVAYVVARKDRESFPPPSELCYCRSNWMINQLGRGLLGKRDGIKWDSLEFLGEIWTENTQGAAVACNMPWKIFLQDLFVLWIQNKSSLVLSINHSNKWVNPNVNWSCFSNVITVSF